MSLYWWCNQFCYSKFYYTKCQVQVSLLLFLTPWRDWGHQTLLWKRSNCRLLKQYIRGSVCLSGCPLVLGRAYAIKPSHLWWTTRKAYVASSESCAVLVVSPLTSLMVDQVQSLRCRGVQSSIITSGSDLAKSLLATESSLFSDSLLYCAPEALVLPKWRGVLENRAVSDRIVAVVVDEAHCISKW